MPTSEPIATAAPVTARPRVTVAAGAAGAAGAVGTDAAAAQPTSAAGIKPIAPTQPPTPTEPAVAPSDTPAPEATPTLAPTVTQPPPATARPRPASTTSGASSPAQPSAPGNANDPPPSFEIVVPQPGVSEFSNPIYDLRIISTGFERWGRPTAGGGCEQYYDVTPVYQLKLTMQITNNSRAPLRNWSAQYFAGGTPVTTCHDGGGALPTIQPGEQRVVRLLAYVNNDQNVTSFVINGGSNTVRTCFAANKVIRCG